MAPSVVRAFFYHIQPPLDYHSGEKVIPSKRSVPLLREPSSCLLNFNLPSCYFHRYFLILFSGMIAGKKPNLHLSSHILGDLKDHSSQKWFTLVIPPHLVFRIVIFRVYSVSLASFEVLNIWISLPTAENQGSWAQECIFLILQMIWMHTHSREPLV